jgi:hypothetical protein
MRHILAEHEHLAGGKSLQPVRDKTRARPAQDRGHFDRVVIVPARAERRHPAHVRRAVDDLHRAFIAVPTLQTIKIARAEVDGFAWLQHGVEGLIERMLEMTNGERRGINFLTTFRR